MTLQTNAFKVYKVVFSDIENPVIYMMSWVKFCNDTLRILFYTPGSKRCLKLNPQYINNELNDI